MYVIILLKHILQKLKLEASSISNNFHYRIKYIVRMKCVSNIILLSVFILLDTFKGIQSSMQPKAGLCGNQTYASSMQECFSEV